MLYVSFITYANLIKRPRNTTFPHLLYVQLQPCVCCVQGRHKVQVILLIALSVSTKKKRSEPNRGFVRCVKAEERNPHSNNWLIVYKQVKFTPIVIQSFFHLLKCDHRLLTRVTVRLVFDTENSVTHFRLGPSRTERGLRMTPDSYSSLTSAALFWRQKEEEGGRTPIRRF